MMQPPTDNLYKFLAVFGLILFGFSWYVPLQRLEEHNREVARWNAAWGAMMVRAQQADDGAREVLECAITKAMPNRGTATLMTKECAQVEVAKARAHVASNELSRAMKELEGGRYLLDHLGKLYATYLTLGLATGILGLLACISGFWLWYVRVQRPLDVAINERATAPSARLSEKDET